MPILLPVILPVSDAVAALRGREKAQALGRSAREAVRRSAERGGLAVPAFLKAENGAPLPNAGVFWSLSHKERFVAGVAATVPVGIDIEAVKTRSEALFRKIADEAERYRLGAGPPSMDGFHRCWTAKEAVLKAAGVGLTRLSHCRLLSAPSGGSVLLVLDGKTWSVVHHRFDGHVAAVTAETFSGVSWERKGAEGSVKGRVPAPKDGPGDGRAPEGPNRINRPSKWVRS